MSLSPDIICLTETFLPQDVSDSILAFQRHHFLCLWWRSQPLWFNRSGYGASAGLLSGLSAVDLKVKFPVVICPVLTVYFLTYMLLCVPSSVLFQKSCYFVRFCQPCLTGCLRPTLCSPRCTIVFMCIFSPLPSISIFPTFPTYPIPPN